MSLANSKHTGHYVLGKGMFKMNVSWPVIGQFISIWFHIGWKLSLNTLPLSCIPTSKGDGATWRIRLCLILYNGQACLLSAKDGVHHTLWKRFLISQNQSLHELIADCWGLVSCLPEQWKRQLQDRHCCNRCSQPCKLQELWPKPKHYF